MERLRGVPSKAEVGLSGMQNSKQKAEVFFFFFFWKLSEESISRRKETFQYLQRVRWEFLLRTDHWLWHHGDSWWPWQVYFQYSVKTEAWSPEREMIREIQWAAGQWGLTWCLRLWIQRSVRAGLCLSWAGFNCSSVGKAGAVFNQSCPASLKEAVQEAWTDGARNLKMRKVLNSEKVVKQWFGGGGLVRAWFIILINTTNAHRSLQSLLGEFHTAWCPPSLSRSTTRLYFLHFILIWVYNNAKIADAHYKWVYDTTDTL